jgi:hypothetical protein
MPGQDRPADFISGFELLQPPGDSKNWMKETQRSYNVKRRKRLDGAEKNYFIPGQDEQAD